VAKSIPDHEKSFWAMGQSLVVALHAADEALVSNWGKLFAVADDPLS
jgi:hypothetical protein